MKPGCSSVDGRSIVTIIPMSGQGALTNLFTVKLKGKGMAGFDVSRLTSQILIHASEEL